MRNPPWSDSEVTIVREKYTTMTHGDIGVLIGRSRNAVRVFCHKNGLIKGADDWTDEEIAKLKDGYPGKDEAMDLVCLAASLGRLKSNVCRKARSLGLTNIRRPRTEEFAAAAGQRSKARIAANGHPRGALGLVHTPETRAQLAAASLRGWEKNKEAKIAALLGRSKGMSRGKSGRRPDLGGLYVRSRWEANYARYLNFLQRQGLVESWEYEPKTFYFESIKRGTRSYTPDFKVVRKDGTYEWHEVKGWMDDKSRVKLERMAKFFPLEKVIVIGPKWFASARSSIAPLIPNWERK